MQRQSIWCLVLAILLGCGPSGVLGVLDDKTPAEPPVKGKEKANRELHAVGLYEGFTKSDGKIHGGKALVTVDRPGKLVTLVLTSYDPVTWEVTLGKDTKLDKVILGGASRAAVKGLPEKVEVVEAFRGAKDPSFPFYVYKADIPAFRSLVDALDSATGQQMSSFTGLYRAEAGVPIVIDKVQEDERFSSDFPKVGPTDKLPKVTFLANHYLPGTLGFDETRSFGEFTLSGPKVDSLKPLPDRVARMTYDPNGKKYYGIANHGVAEIDLEKKKVNNLDPGLDVPRISWPADITFDTKRERMLLISSGGPGYLYAYYPKTGKWEAISERPPAVITYHPKDDMLYGLKGDDGRVLHQINEKGAVIKTVKLDGPLLPGMLGLGPGVTGVQLIPADDKLVLLISPTGLRPSENPGPKWSYMYLVDPKTGKAQLTWKEKVGK